MHKTQLEIYRDPCIPSPCGPFAQCHNNNGIFSCSCLLSYIGIPPQCRPECTINSDCPSHLACMNQKCQDPCPGACGLNANCNVYNHLPICTCFAGYEGNAFIACHPATVPVEPHRDDKDLCNPTPCGANAICSGAGHCECIPEYFGDPYILCHPECLLNSECPSNKACINQKCQDPCPGTCGNNALCNVYNHVAMCYCPEGMTGNAFVNCEFMASDVVPVINPCYPSPCGPNSECHDINGQAICKCLPNYQGAPPSCHPECVSHAECALNKACINQKCIDPCPGACGLNAVCSAINHQAICNCMPGYTGNPLVACQRIPVQADIVPQNVCQPSPCGPYSQCRVVEGNPSCSCLRDYIGSPPNCKPECITNSDCAPNKACQNNKCHDPCPGVCGQNAICHVVNHAPNCACLQGYTGNPFLECKVYQDFPIIEITSPCVPSPCGANARCQERNGAGACMCLPNFFGDPYVGCRPECVVNSDCASNLACIQEKCKDPCPGTCGQYAECYVNNHLPVCNCYNGYTGDPYVYCSIIPNKDSKLLFYPEVKHASVC